MRADNDAGENIPENYRLLEAMKDDRDESRDNHHHCQVL
jgi:hypothetical protein